MKKNWLTIAGALGAASIAHASEARQTTPQPTSNTCQTTSNAAGFAYGSTIEQKDCPYAAPKTAQDYVAVNISWSPQGTGIDPAAALLKNGGRTTSGRPAWRSILTALRRAALYRVDETGTATLRVFRARAITSVSDSVGTTAQTWAKCGSSGRIYDKSKYDLVLLRPLNAWSVTESDGYKVESVMTRLSGRQGLIFLANEGNQFEVELCVSHTSQTRPQVVNTLRLITGVSTAFGRDDALVSDSILGQLGAVEAEVAKAVGFETGGASVWQVGWGPNQVHRVDVGIGLPWEQFSGGETKSAPSLLTVQSETLATIFPGNHQIRDRTIRYSFAGGRSAVLKQPLSDMTVEEALDPSFLRTFGDETVSPSIWENSCETLERKLGQRPLSSLNDGDVLAVVWASFASQEPISNPKIRSQNCTQRIAFSADRSEALEKAGLPTPKLALSLPPGPYKDVFDRAMKASQLAEEAARTARPIAASQVPAALLNSGKVTRDALGGSFTGVLSTADSTGIGRIVFTAADFEDAVWEGTVSVSNGLIIAQGPGTYTYPKGHKARVGCSADQKVTFYGSAASNQLRQGRIVYCDGAVFTGELTEDDLASFGRQTQASGDNFRVLYGEFEGKDFGVGGEGVEEIRAQENGITVVKSQRTGIWVKGVYQGQ